MLAAPAATKEPKAVVPELRACRAESTSASTPPPAVSPVMTNA